MIPQCCTHLLIMIVHAFRCRCTPPNKGNDYQKIYSDWCHEFEKYKSAMKSWEKKQAVSRVTVWHPGNWDRQRCEGKDSSFVATGTLYW